MSASPKLIYDFGAHEGKNLRYYLLRADRVVAVEANPELADRIKSNFAEEVAAGRLVVVNCVVTPEENASNVPFYVHRESSLLSQFDPPENGDAFAEVMLPARSVLSIIAEHGEPYYTKFDVEHLDARLLLAMFQGGCRPPYVSAEAHHAEVLGMLIGIGGYRSLKLLESSEVGVSIRTCEVPTATGVVVHHFDWHSAGPFGNDVPGPWLKPLDVMRALTFSGLGWRDLHASNVDRPDPGPAPRLRDYVLRAGVNRVRRFLPW